MSRKAVIILAVLLALTFVVIPGFIVLGLAVAELGATERGASPLASGLGCLEVEGAIMDSRRFVRELRSLEHSPMVKGFLVLVNSPGGAVTPSHEMYAELKRVRESGKPVVVSMSTLAASGGYYVSCPASVIVANPGTLTGSIGVIMEFPQLKGMLDKLGLGVAVIRSDKHKDIGSPFRPMTDSDRDLLQGVVTDVHEQFMEVVATERGIPLDRLRPLADGRIFTGRQAHALGLVDTLGTYEDAKRIAADLCGIKGEPRLIRPRRSFRSTLLRLMDGAAENLLGLPRFPRFSYRWP